MEEILGTCGVFAFVELEEEVHPVRIWAFNWPVNVRMTPLESFLNPITLRNLTTPAGKNIHRM